MSVLGAAPSSSKPQGDQPRIYEGHGQLHPPISSPVQGLPGPSLHSRKQSRGRSLSRRPPAADPSRKGSLHPSNRELSKNKLKAPMERSDSQSPVPHSVRQKVADKVFDVIPPSRGTKQRPSTSKPPGHKPGYIAPVRSWANIARTTAKGYALSFIPPMVVNDKIVVNIPNEVLFAADPKWEECLVGYFIGKKLPFKMIEAALRHVWGAYLEEIIANDEGFYFFHIPDQVYRRNIVDSGCFTIAKVPLILQQYNPSMDLQKAKHKAVPIWIRLRHLPLSLWSAMGISSVASALGKPLYVDSLTENMKRISFARVCVEVEGGSPLPGSVEVNIGGEVRTILVEYEWKPSFCSLCGTFGHRCPPPTNPVPPESPSPVPCPAQGSVSPPPPKGPQSEEWQVVGKKRTPPPADTRDISPSLEFLPNPGTVQPLLHKEQVVSSISEDEDACSQADMCDSPQDRATHQPIEPEVSQVPASIPEGILDPPIQNKSKSSKKNKKKNKAAQAQAESSSANTVDTPRLRVAVRQHRSGK